MKYMFGEILEGTRLIEIEDFYKFVRLQFSIKGLTHSSLVDLFTSYFTKFTDDKKFVNQVSAFQRQILRYQVTEDHSILMNLKYFIDNSEFLELEVEVFDDRLELNFVESLHREFTYESDEKLIISREQFFYKENELGLTFCKILSYLFYYLFTPNPSAAISNLLSIDQSHIGNGTGKYYARSTINDDSNFWIFNS